MDLFGGADFDYEVINDQVLVIFDRDAGGASVTNDIAMCWPGLRTRLGR